MLYTQTYFKVSKRTVLAFLQPPSEERMVSRMFTGYICTTLVRSTLFSYFAVSCNALEFVALRVWNKKIKFPWLSRNFPKFPWSKILSLFAKKTHNKWHKTNYLVCVWGLAPILKKLSQTTPSYVKSSYSSRLLLFLNQ